MPEQRGVAAGPEVLKIEARRVFEELVRDLEKIRRSGPAIIQQGATPSWRSHQFSIVDVSRLLRNLGPGKSVLGMARFY